MGVPTNYVSLRSFCGFRAIFSRKISIRVPTCNGLVTSFS
ncbi:hypothetical protein LEP1GSC171_0120 [Leptospira santarosai str. HAI1380]|uniref:Uncharacterized protein n=1 Tax=Leptospira santarosai str. ZUN179 TaxID=1049985 RepID=M6UPU6_9LEPT|nr:hypothetical protein LEP1GSC175_0437 [Leptospira santarosai str. HAI821]EMO44816.1 hypothetical protein LEP1GSC187_0406 [Leptospira santarosai str. ZUN179]EMO86086.1 hypothetical protein LEP1GSC070_1052 [Leptospira santarosai str. AIM]EMP02362.1 hypothetical protein LEP1GSC171_0120 [Leptospira santarosai str. HAI1380]